MGIVFQKDKRIGVTYAYESEPYWDKEKQQSRSRRKLIGRLDETTGEIVPTRKRKKVTVNNKNFDIASLKDVKRRFYGATYLLEQIGEKTGVTDDLKRCFPESYKQILSIAFYLILEDRNPISKFSKWSMLHKHPFDREISSQRGSELMASITDEARENFFLLQGKRRHEDEFLLYDTTSISSYSAILKQVRYGVNKDDESLPQINLALLFGEKSGLPFYYRKLPGNISDVKTVQKLIRDTKILEHKKIKLVMDRGFYSKANIDALYKSHYKFLIGTKTNLKYVRTKIDEVSDSITDFSNYSSEYEIYAHTETTLWNYEAKRPYIGDTLKEGRRLYQHTYYNTARADADTKKLNRLLTELSDELKNGKLKSKHKKLYEKYFNVIETPVRGLKAEPNQSAIDAEKKYYGYFSLISNTIKDKWAALSLYRNKDCIEKSFDDLKDRLNFRRTGVSSEKTLDGKVFVEFISLIFLSFLKNQMKKHDLYKKFTLQEMLDELDVIEIFEHSGHKPHVGEVSGRQEEIYEFMEINSISSLC